ncbi:DgyrCDS6911 [Dimorphilus gyrociliatus]|uniref:Large ribosomal subunit protein bL32m n=1 Tax=Dimorphilus gyrociliatus TaxID=2664684 RepID=A0A7I8VPF9_9ANNE|nr:DgyrCDS6911 [Dimorphilus gyrociliatus]
MKNLIKFTQILNRIQFNIDRCISSLLFNDKFRFAYDVAPPVQQSSENNQLSLKDIVNDSILWAVPKSRRSVERRFTRRMRFHKHFEHATPKKNITPCLECGNWMERGTICGHCYEKVRDETEEMQNKIPEKIRNFDAPTKEIQFHYEDDDPQIRKENKYIVDMKKKRPTWFNANLLSKGFGRYS